MWLTHRLTDNNSHLLLKPKLYVIRVYVGGCMCVCALASTNTLKLKLNNFHLETLAGLLPIGPVSVVREVIGPKTKTQTNIFLENLIVLHILRISHIPSEIAQD